MQKYGKILWFVKIWHVICSFDGFCDFFCFTWLSQLSHSKASSHYPCSTQHQLRRSSSKALVTFFLLYDLRPTFFGSTTPHLHLKLVLITSLIPPHTFIPTFYYEKCHRYREVERIIQWRPIYLTPRFYN